MAVILSGFSAKPWPVQNTDAAVGPVGHAIVVGRLLRGVGGRPVGTSVAPIRYESGIVGCFGRSAAQIVRLPGRSVATGTRRAPTNTWRIAGG